jgi:hypothetical protein
MSTPIGSSNYQITYYKLTDTNSVLIKIKKEFETLFELFLERYRPYSSVGRSLSEPIFYKKDILKLF